MKNITAQPNISSPPPRLNRICRLTRAPQFGCSVCKLGTTLTICPSWKHYLVRSGVERSEKFFYQASFDSSCFAWSNQVTHDRFQPCIFANPENHTRMLVHIQFVHWRAGKQFAKSLHAFEHFLS